MWITFFFGAIFLHRLFSIFYRFVQFAFSWLVATINPKAIFNKFGGISYQTKRDPTFYEVSDVYIYYWKILENSTNCKYGSVSNR